MGRRNPLGQGAQGVKAPRPPRAFPCDLCGAANAPFGFQRPGGRKAQAPGTRPLWACPDCRAAAAERARKATVARLGEREILPAARRKRRPPDLFDR